MLVFAEVVERGSFTAAAAQLGRSKASISKEVAALEKRLGAQLLRRTTRSMSLTEIGEAFFERCQRVAEQTEQAELSVSELQAEPRGEIRVAAPMSFGHRILAGELPNFLQKHPDLRVDVDLTDRRIDLIREKFDLALRIGNLRDSTLVARRVAPVRAIVVASPAYLAEHGKPAAPEDLVNHECLNYGPPPVRWNFDEDRQVETRGRLNMDNGDALLAAAVAGFGVTYLPTFVVADAIRAGDLVPLFLEETFNREGSLWAVYPSNRHLSPKVRAFIDHFANVFGNHPDWDSSFEASLADPS